MKVTDYFESLEKSLRQNANIVRVDEPQAEKQRFRYDNAPHHPEIVTFPHHKHGDISSKPTPTDQPTLSQVMSEIEQELTSM